jgi:hypothetical protein
MYVLLAFYEPGNETEITKETRLLAVPKLAVKKKTD